MSDFWSFITSPEAVIVYIVVGLSCCLCFMIYLVERYNVKLRQKHNTKELNKLVEQVRDQYEEEETEEEYNQPVLQVIKEEEKASSVTELLERTVSLYEKPQEEEVEENTTPVIVPLEPEIVKSVEEVEKKEELTYTTIEPNPIEAKEELNKMAEELAESMEVQNETLTSFEEQQEENAIISLEELIQKGRVMYAENEHTQYADEGNVPISLGELEEKIGKEVTPYTENFVLENVVPEAEKVEIEEKVPVVEEVVREDTTNKWKSSPIISPVFGIERQDDLALENTANYEKFDAAKTNEFLMTLKELQEKLE